MNIHSHLKTALAAAIGALLVLASASSAAAQTAARLRVLATFPPMAIFAKNVAGDAADVRQLLPPGAEPHDFSLSPGDLRKIVQADVIVENGVGLEGWLDNALQNSHASIVIASKGIATDDMNPHIWLDPILATAEVQNIADALAARDPANAATYRRNATAYIAKLKALDAEIRSATDQMTNKRLVPFHDAFHYFAKRYGFEVVDVFEEFPGREPTPRELKTLRDRIKDRNVRVLFAEPQQSPQILLAVSRELKLPIVEIDPMEMSDPTPDKYETTMRANLKHLTEALGER